MFKNILFGSVAVVVLLGLSACGHKKVDQAQAASQSGNTIHTVTVKAETYTNPLYFSGYFAPLNTTPVTSPVEGTVIQQAFIPGSEVKKGQLLFEIKAGLGENSASSNLASFLKAKDSLNAAKNTMQNSEILYKGGLVPRNEYQSDVSNYYSQSLAYEQAKQILQQSLVAYHDLENVYSLTLEDTTQIHTVLRKLASQQIVKIISPTDGVALLANNDDNSGDDSSDNNAASDSSGPVKVGSQVKVNGVLINIGMYKGMAIKIEVNEINIEQLKLGQKATITNVALPKLSLTGYVQNISAQASNTGALPTFSVSIVVPSIPAAYLSRLHFGMSAKIAIDMVYPAKILIPIKAVIQSAGSTQVNLLEKNGKTKLVPVTTGETTEDSVVIVSGLKAGDQVIVPH